MSKYELPPWQRIAAETLVRNYVRRAADKHEVAEREILSPNRTRRVSFARWEVMGNLRDEGYSLAEIGALLDRDHTTVLHGLRQVTP